MFPHQSIKNRIIRKKPHWEDSPTHDPATGLAPSVWKLTFILWKIIIAIINQRFSIGINEDLLNLFSKSGNQKSEIQQYKSKPSSLEIALKLRKMPSLKLNYSSSAFSRALLHNKKVRTRYFGDETSQIPSTPCPGAWEGLDGIFWPTLKHFVPNKQKIPTIVWKVA